jgi:hypothetical protein
LLTKQTPSFGISPTLQDRQGPIDLFEQDSAAELVGHRHLREGEPEVGPPQDAFGQAEAADDEAEAAASRSRAARKRAIRPTSAPVLHQSK